MAFGMCAKAAPKRPFGGIRPETLYAQGCDACTLRKEWPHLEHPNMKPAGSDEPLVYMLGEAPGAQEDERGVPFVGAAGKVLRFRVPTEWVPHLRWNNCVRTRPPNNRDPTDLELECCRRSIVEDIEATKPKAIFGFGNVPLRWAFRQSRITNWEGRRVPIQIGSHRCWFFPFVHPSYLARLRKFKPHSQDQYPSDAEFAFALALQRAFDSIETLPEPDIHTRERAQENLEWVTGSEPDALSRVIEHVRHASTLPSAGLDYETNTERPYSKDAKILTVAIATKDKSFAFPLYHPHAGWDHRDRRAVEDELHNFLYSNCRKISHSLAFEQEWSAYFYGKECLHDGKWADTMSQAFILDERRGCLSLDFLCLQYFGLNIKAIDNLDRANLEKAAVVDVLRYNALDAKYHRLLYLEQRKRLRDEGLMEVYQHQITRIPTFVLTSMLGLTFDQDVVKRYYTRYKKRADKILAKLHETNTGKRFKRLRGHDIKPWSAPDVQFIFHRMLKFGEGGTDEKALKKFDHPIARIILNWRKASKLLGTYIEPVMEGSKLVYPDGRTHGVYKTTATRTNRTSADGPNIQNQPKRNAKEIRSMLRPGDGLVVVPFDYGQIQARNVAMESEDAALVKAFWDRYDIHSAWMERVIELVPKWGGGKEALKDGETRSKLRNRAKNEIVFPLFFGSQAKSVAASLEVPERVGEKIYEEFWGAFPDIKRWHERIRKDYYRKGYVTGKSGFRRRAPISINQLINSPIQADEAKIVCDAMTRLSRRGLQASMEIHDDLTFIWREDDVETLAKAVIEEMVNVPFKWAQIVPIVVEMSIGKDWGNTKKVGDFSSDTWKGKFDAAQLKVINGEVNE